MSLDLLTPEAEPFCGWSQGFQLPPDYKISEWADEHRVIAHGTGSEPGLWRTDRLPLLREVMDALNSAAVHTLVLCCSSQAAKTETLMNIVGYYIDQDPAPQMFVLPTLELADSFSVSRFAKTVDATPVLRDKMGGPKSRDANQTIREKQFPGGDLVFAGANSPASLASRPRRIVAFDEVDKYRENIGQDGDPIAQGIQRTQNYYNRKIIIASTPTQAGVSAIEYWFKQSDQRYRLVPCPECGHMQRLQWFQEIDGEKIQRVRWQPGQPETAEYICAGNGCVWDQRRLRVAVSHGVWQATSKAVDPGIVGFHWWSLYTPWVSMADLAREWEKCDGYAAREQTFINLKLGEVWHPTRSAATTPEMLLARREDYGPEKLPAGVLAITAFVDVQGDRWECTYLGWGALEEKWVIDHAVHYGDPTDPAQWEAMDERLLRRVFTHDSGAAMQIEAIGVDAGYLQQMVLDFCRTRRQAFRPFYAVKGKEGFGRPLWSESAEKFKLGAKLYLSGIDDGKTQLYQELAAEKVRVHFPRQLELPWFKQLVVEKIKMKPLRGRFVPEWHCPQGARNEALDCVVGNMAVRQTLQSIDWEARRRGLYAETKKSIDFSSLADKFKG